MTLARSFTGFGRIPPEEGLNPAELAVVDQLATYLASRDAVNAGVLPVALRTRMESLGLSRRAISIASRLVLEPPLTGRNRWGSPTKTDDSNVPMVRRVAGDEPTWRARYLLQAAKRLTEADDFAPALAAERRYLRLHRLAGRQRRAGAMQADQAQKRSRTGLLIWEGGSCPDCKARNGTVLMPGELPPPAHPHCRCWCRPF